MPKKHRGGFTKKRENERAEKLVAGNKLRAQKKREERAGRAARYAAMKTEVKVGRRIVELDLLAKLLWCKSCDKPLSLRDMTKEILFGFGLASIMTVQCATCLLDYSIPTSKKVPNPEGRELYATNCKAVLGCIDSGIGPEQLNKLLSAVNVPVMHRNTFQLSQSLVGKFVVQAADDSCKDAIALERQLTLEQMAKDRNNLQQLLENGIPPEVEEASENCPLSIEPESEGSDVDDPSACSAQIQPMMVRPKHRVHNEDASTPRRTQAQINEINSTTTDSSQTPRKRKRDSSSQVSTSPGPPSERPCERQEVPIVVTYDYGWDKRGNGFKYDSQSGRGSLFGQLSEKCLGYQVMSTYCAMCARGHPKENHDCVQNHDGSAKSMEPQAAVLLCLKNDNLKEAAVRVGTLVGDRDASTMAALMRESPHPIKKLVDLNHNTKGFNNALYNMKKSSKQFSTYLSVDSIEYLKRCVNTAIKQNKNNVDGVRAAKMNVANHVFNDHLQCGDWCKAKDNPGYKFKNLPKQQPYSDAAFREELVKALQSQANDAEKLAPCGSTQKNESFNHQVVSRAPKAKHYCGTAALQVRVAAAVCHQNLGAMYINRVCNLATLTPHAFKFRQSLQNSIARQNQYKKLNLVKKRRLQLKLHGRWKEATQENSGGITYASGMGSVMERAVAAAASVTDKAVSSWLPEPSELTEDCKFVVVDIESNGLQSSDEIIQLGAVCEGEEFSCYILPSKQIHPRATQSTGFKLHRGKLCRHNVALATVLAVEAATAFMDFLKKCGSQIVIVGHNIVRFDAPMILQLMKNCGLSKEFCNVVHSIVDTLPLIKQGDLQKQDLLAAKYLTDDEWQNLHRMAHDALVDCKLLNGLLKHFKVDVPFMRTKILKMTDFLMRQIFNQRKKLHSKDLMVMSEEGTVSKNMVGKMAGAGVALEELVKEFDTHGRKGVEVCLGVQIGGAPRVTRSKPVITKIVELLENRRKISIEF